MKFLSVTEQLHILKQFIHSFMFEKKIETGKFISGFIGLLILHRFQICFY